MEIVKTDRFTATLGINEGYSHNNENSKTPKEIVANIRQEQAQKSFDETNIYISAVIKDSNTVYSTKWGCPEGGEDTAEISGSRNPEFIKDVEKWKQAVLDVLLACKNELKQETAQVAFNKVEMTYLK